jgi:hypothetical protein
MIPPELKQKRSSGISPSENDRIFPEERSFHFSVDSSQANLFLPDGIEIYKAHKLLCAIPFREASGFRLRIPPQCS